MCEHRWMQVHEELLIGGHYLTGYECVDCGKYMDKSELTPVGIGGTILNKHKLVGPNGGHGNTSDGGVYKYQIYDEDTGKLKVVR